MNAVDTVTQRYAEALYGLAASKGALEDVVRDVERLAAEFAVPKVRSLLLNPRFSVQVRLDRLKPLLEQMDGFISVERFESLTTPGKLLSLSFFRDEAALDTWRQLAAHRKAQSRGRSDFFDDYRLRVAGVIRDYGKFDRDESPKDSRDRHG